MKTIICIIIAAVVCGASACSSKSDYEKEKAEFEEERQELAEEKAQLRKEYEELRQEYQQEKADYQREKAVLKKSLSSKNVKKDSTLVQQNVGNN